jgi:hypothetical protein
MSTIGPLVKAALRSLTRNVNLSTGILHPADRDLAVEMFYKLKEAGEIFAPKEIENYLEGQGWQQKDARMVADIARKMNQGIRPRRLPASLRPWASDILDQWRRSAEEPEE